MYLIVIAWVYVVLMMAVAEANHSSGTLLGAIVTFVLYGLMPLAIVMYLIATPSRRAAKRAAQIAAREALAVPTLPVPVSVAAPDRGDHAAGDAVAPVREEP
jgi:hypothetical protein